MNRDFSSPKIAVPWPKVYDIGECEGAKGTEVSRRPWPKVYDIGECEGAKGTEVSRRPWLKVYDIVLRAALKNWFPEQLPVGRKYV
jgi:hypothetical protein